MSRSGNFGGDDNRLTDRQTDYFVTTHARRVIKSDSTACIKSSITHYSEQLSCGISVCSEVTSIQGYGYLQLYTNDMQIYHRPVIMHNNYDKISH